MSWQLLRLRLSARDLPRAEALLQLAGAQSLSVHDAGTEPLLEPGVGETPVWSEVELRVLFMPGHNLADIRSVLDAGSIDLADEPIVEIVRDMDWADAWRQSVSPLTVAGRLDIVAASANRAGAAAGQLALNMGLAFGTGQHPTTRLCLEGLAAHVERGMRVLDYGCGSGILALAALKLGAGSAWATDNDPQALQATRDNAEINDLTDAIWIGPPDELPDISADLLVANILAEPLCALAPSLALRQPESACLLLSGLLRDQIERVAAAYSPSYESLETAELDGWCLLSGRRNARR